MVSNCDNGTQLSVAERSFSVGTFWTELQNQFYYRNWTLFNCHNEKNNKSLWSREFFGSRDPTNGYFLKFRFSLKAFTEIRANMLLKVRVGEYSICNGSPRYGCPIAIVDLIAFKGCTTWLYPLIYKTQWVHILISLYFPYYFVLKNRTDMIVKCLETCTKSTKIIRYIISWR